MRRKITIVVLGLAAVALMAFNGRVTSANVKLPLADTNKWPAKFGFGRPAEKREVAAWDIDIRPDGRGLPKGEGTAITGKAIYLQKCVACHGTGIEHATVKLPAPALISDTSYKSKPKTIGNYWPYATTLFDYIRRAMPYAQPGSLTDDEVYSLTAYLLNANRIMKPETILNAKSLPKIIMPAKKLFVFDDRKGGPEVK